MDQTTLNSIRIIQINIRSLRVNKNILEIYAHKEKIDIILINETWLKNTNFKLSGYNMYANNRDDGYGGVAIFIKNAISSKQNNVNLSTGPIETIYAEATINNTNYLLCSIYIPPNQLVKDIENNFQNILNF